MRNSVDFFLAGLTDVDGNPCYGYLIYTYEAGTTTPKETYTDAELTTPATNPIVLDVSGRASIFANGSFKFVLKTPEGETVYTWDNLYFGENSAFRNRGDWETDTVYNPGDYVFDRSTDDGDVKSMWFVLGAEAFTSSTQPYLDTDNWSEFPAVAGPQGETGDTGPTGDTGATGASITSAAFVGDDIVFTKDDSNTVTLADAVTELQGPQGIQGEKGDTGDVSDDFTDYSEKTSIVDDDLFLINDSEATGALKYIKKSVLGGGGGGDIGDFVFRPTSSIPSGCLECDGSAISRTTYADLYSVIGTQYGVGDGSTTFNIPDWRGKFPRGWANGSTNDPDRASRTDRGDGTTGDYVGTNQASQNLSHYHYHRHSFSIYSQVDGAAIPRGSAGGGSAATMYTSFDSTASGGNESRPINMNSLICIRYE